MTDRERVARAICAALCGTDDHECSFPSCGCGKPPECADAALAAMPTWRRIPGEVVEWSAARKAVLAYRGQCVPPDLYSRLANAEAALQRAADAPIAPLPTPPAGEVG